MFGKLTIALRLTLGFGLFFVMLLASVVLGLNRLETIENMMERIVTKDWRKTVLVNDAIDLMNTNARETFLLFMTKDRAVVKQRIAENVKTITAKLEELEKLLYKPEGKAMLAEIREKRKTYVNSFLNVGKLLDAGQDAEATRVMTAETVPALDALLASVDKLIKIQGQILEDTGQETRDIYAWSRNVLILFLAVMAVVAVILATWIIRAVTRPLGAEPDDAKAIVARIAQGDLTQEIALRQGDSDSLLAAMRHMQTSLRKLIGELKANADGVASAAHQLSSASEQLAIGTAQQSEAASSMAAAVEEMTVSINHVSDSANEARQVTDETGEQSNNGKRVIQDTVAEMKEISRTVAEASETIHAVGENSQKISSIVQVIKDVADQTNLLALNAAIEAARAGEQGRGFAVVADEVRKLAERTAQATTEIGDMINAVQSSAQAAVGTMQQAVARVEGGVEMANRAGESMSGISDGAERVVSAVNEISSALKEQSVASNEIASNVERIAQMSEENSAATREAADTARQLEALAVGTRTAVSQFRV
ncbi:MAG: chemotaxis protein [Rhodocyclales bacterium]|nr:MAG: chemotaxis protein [Rhodocyclales bacterium]